MKQKDLETYGDLYWAMTSEGDGYYFYGYEDADHLDFDPELKELFINASTALEKYKSKLEDRITKNGGEPSDYQA